MYSYYTDKNVPFVSHSDLDPRKINLFLYASIPFMILCQYQYVAQPDRLNNGQLAYVSEKTSTYRSRLQRDTK